MYRHEPLTGARAGAGQRRRDRHGPRDRVRLHVRARVAATTSGSIAALGGGALWDVGSYPVTLRAADRRRTSRRWCSAPRTGTTRASTKSSWACCGSTGGIDAPNIYAGFRAAYRTWLEVLGSDGALTRAQPVPARPARDAGARARRRASSRSRSTGSPQIFVREIEDFEASVARRRAAGRQPGREPRATPPRCARRSTRLALERRPRRSERRCILNRWKRRDPTVLWRLFRKGPTKTERARAVILPGGPPYTLTFFANDEMDRVENFETMDLALFRADDIKRSLARRRLEGRLQLIQLVDKRHRTVGVKVGNVTVGGGAPVVVQSMTMTDTADAGVDGAAVHRAVAGRLGDGARHGEPARSRGRGARDQAAHARRRLHRAADRRLPLQRPPAADALSRLRAGARQVPHQPRQRRHRQAPRRAVRDHLPGRDRSRQAGAHRRQRRLPQPGAGDGEDAGEHRSQPRQGLRRHHQRVHGAVGDAVDRAGDRDRPAQGPDHHLVQAVAAART